MAEFTQERFEYDQSFGLGELPASIDLSPNGKCLVTGGYEDRIIKIWDIQTGKIVRYWLAEPPNPYRIYNAISALAISPDGNTLVTGGNSLKAWEFETGKQLRILKGSSSWIPYITIGADGQIMVTEGGVGSEGAMIVWDLKQGKKIRRRIGTISVKWVVSPDGKTVVGEDHFDESLKVWDIKTGKELQTLDNRYAIRVQKIAFSVDGKLLASGGFDGIKIWEFESSEQIQRVEKYKNVRYHKHLDYVYNIIFSPDGKSLLSSGRDGLIQIWDIGTGKNVGTIQGENPIGRIAMSSDFRTLVGFGGHSQNELTVEVWRVTH